MSWIVHGDLRCRSLRPSVEFQAVADRVGGDLGQVWRSDVIEHTRAVAVGIADVRFGHSATAEVYNVLLAWIETRLTEVCYPTAIPLGAPRR